MINLPLLVVSQEIYTIGIFIGSIFVILLIMEIQICQLRFRIVDLEKGSSSATDSSSAKVSAPAKDSSPATVRLDDLLSAEGVAVTKFELSGTVNIKGNKVDVISEGGKIPINSNIKVTSVRGNKVVVKPVNREFLHSS